MVMKTCFSSTGAIYFICDPRQVAWCPHYHLNLHFLVRKSIICDSSSRFSKAASVGSHTTWVRCEIASFTDCTLKMESLSVSWKSVCVSVSLNRPRNLGMNGSHSNLAHSAALTTQSQSSSLFFLISDNWAGHWACQRNAQEPPLHDDPKTQSPGCHGEGEWNGHAGFTVLYSLGCS